MADLLTFDGLQTTTSSFLQKESQLSLAINVEFTKIGSVRKRLGYSQYGDTLSGGNPVRGLRSYNSISAGTQNLFAFINGAVMYNNAGTWTNVQTGLQSDADAEFRVFIDELFMVGANSSNVFLDTLNIDGTNPNTGHNLSGSPNGKYVEEYLDKLYIANCQVTGDRRPSRLQYSSVPNAAGDTITWTSTDFETVSTENGEEITGLHANESLNQLLIFKESTLHAWDNFRIRYLGRPGTSHHRSIQTIHFTTYYFKRGSGFYAYSGVQPQLISRGIDKYIQGIQDHTKINSTQERDRIYKTFVGDIVVDNGDGDVTYSNCEINYSVLDNSWTIFSYKDDFRISAEHKVSGVIRPYAGAADGEVHQMAIEGDTVYDDDGTEISAEFMTKALDMNRPEAKKFVDRVMIYSTQAMNLTGRARAKGKDWATHFAINDNEQFVNISLGNSRFTQFHFSESSKEAPFEMHGLSFEPILTSQYT